MTLPASALHLLPLALAGTLAAAFRSGPAPVPARLPVVYASDAAPSCPLTVAKEKEAVIAFEEMMPVVRHPRCNNCHGGVNPLVPYEQGKHMGGFIDTTEIAHSSVQTIRLKCQECHSELEGWDTPGEPMHWNGKSTKEICMQFKRLSHGPADFIGHVTDEHGGVQFIETAFKGERALNDMAKDIPMDDFGIPFVPAPPPGTQADLIASATTWANAVGPQGWNATPACGCEVRTNAWVGSVTATFDRNEPGFGHWQERATTTVWFEFDEDLSRGVPETYWKSTAGKITWSLQAVGGKCTGSASGALPVGLGGDDNPMATIQFEPQGDSILYHANLGPWKDQYYHTTTFSCVDGVKIPMTTPLGVGLWWNHPVEGVILRDAKQLEGSFQSQGLDGSTSTWTWNLRRIEGPRPVR